MNKCIVSISFNLVFQLKFFHPDYIQLPLARFLNIIIYIINENLPSLSSRGSFGTGFHEENTGD